MPVRNESGMKLFLFPNLLSRLHDAGTKWIRHEIIPFPKFVIPSTRCRYEINPVRMSESKWVLQNLNKWIKPFAVASGMKSYRIRVFTRYRIQINPAGVPYSFRTVFKWFSCRYRVDARPIRYSFIPGLKSFWCSCDQLHSYTSCVCINL